MTTSPVPTAPDPLLPQPRVEEPVTPEPFADNVVVADQVLANAAVPASVVAEQDVAVPDVTVAVQDPQNTAVPDVIVSEQALEDAAVQDVIVAEQALEDVAVRDVVFAEQALQDAAALDVVAVEQTLQAVVPDMLGTRAGDSPAPGSETAVLELPSTEAAVPAVAAEAAITHPNDSGAPEAAVMKAVSRAADPKGSEPALPDPTLVEAAVPKAELRGAITPNLTGSEAPVPEPSVTRSSFPKPGGRGSASPEPDGSAITVPKPNVSDTAAPEPAVTAVEVSEAADVAARSGPAPSESSHDQALVIELADPAPSQQTTSPLTEHPAASPSGTTESAPSAVISNGDTYRNDQDVRLARAYLMRVAEPPATALLAFVDAVGPVEAAAAVRAGEVPDRVFAETSARRHLDLAESDIADAERVGARLVVPEDEEWPAWPLLSLAAACDRGLRWAGSALGLWARGSAPLADTFERAVSVVGARAASGYGEYVAAEIGHNLAKAGMTVVSGAAYGIDGRAHHGALTAEGVTVAVLGCGVDIGYPAGHINLLDRIAKAGLVLSEYPPGTPPARYRFLVRNRLIAALSSGTVVVEAGIRSGARNTATTAAALGKVVLAVPGPITSAMSAGCHDLLRTGTAMLAGSVSEILEAVGPVGEHLAEPPVGPTRRTDGLGTAALRVHEALSRRDGRTPARIAVDSGVPIERVRALLPELELTGLAERREEGWRRAPERSRRAPEP